MIESTGDRYVLIDGYLRVRALRNLGRDTVKAAVLPLSEVDALVMAHRLDRSVKRTVIEESWLLRELRETHGLSLQELAGRLDRSASWVSRRLALVRDLPDSVQDLVRRGVLCAHAAMKYLVPLARAKRSDCECLAGSIGERGLSSRQVERLYKGWRLGDPEQRSRIIEKPLLYLKANEEIERVVIVPDAKWTDAVIRDLQIIGSVCIRIRRQVREVIPFIHKFPVPPAVREAWQETRLDFDTLAQVMEEERDAGS